MEAAEWGVAIFTGLCVLLAITKPRHLRTGPRPSTQALMTGQRTVPWRITVRAFTPSGILAVTPCCRAGHISPDYAARCAAITKARIERTGR